MKNRSILIWLAIMVVLLTVWGALRMGQSESRKSTSPESALDARQANEEATPPRSDGPSLVRATRAVAPAEEEPIRNPPDDEVSLPAERLSEIVAEREAQYARLETAGDAMFGEVVQIFAARGTTNPAPIVSGWILAQRWGVYLRGEEGLSRVEDEIARQELERARRKVLIEAPSQELRALLGGAEDAELLAAIEEVGRRHAATVLKVPNGPSSEAGPGDSRSQRRRGRPVDLELDE